MRNIDLVRFGELVEAGVHTVEGLARASRKQLCAIKGLSEQKVEKLKQIGASRRRVREMRAGEGAGAGRAARAGGGGERVPALKQSTRARGKDSTSRGDEETIAD